MRTGLILGLDLLGVDIPDRFMVGVSKFARLSLSPKGPVINYKGRRTGANEIYNAHFFLTLPQSDAHFCPTPLPPSAFLWFVPYNLNRHFLVCKTLCSLNN
jgi:hypothetical protein